MIRAAKHHEITTLSLFEPLMDAGDGAGAEAGFYFNCGVRNALPEHAGDLPSLGKLPDLRLREQVAEKLPAFIQAFKPVDSCVEIVDISCSCVFHTLPW